MQLEVMHHNVRSRTRFENINTLSNIYLQQHPEIVIINSHSISRQDKNLKLFGYSSLTKNKHKYEGVAILVKDTISYSFHTDLTNKNTLAVTLHTNTGNINITKIF